MPGLSGKLQSKYMRSTFMLLFVSHHPPFRGGWRSSGKDSVMGGCGMVK